VKVRTLPTRSAVDTRRRASYPAALAILLGSLSPANAQQYPPSYPAQPPAYPDPPQPPAYPAPGYAGPTTAPPPLQQEAVPGVGDGVDAGLLELGRPLGVGAGPLCCPALSSRRLGSRPLASARSDLGLGPGALATLGSARGMVAAA